MQELTWPRLMLITMTRRCIARRRNLDTVKLRAMVDVGAPSRFFKIPFIFCSRKSSIKQYEAHNVQGNLESKSISCAIVCPQCLYA